jgi:non-canonical poly(A) RNA polymerase PAPD5/7
LANLKFISANRKNGYEAKKVIKNVLENFPFMRPLIYVLKYFLRQRKLNESYTGGISSFLLFNLLFSYIQFFVKENEKKEWTLGNLLVGFLQFYAFDFNYEQVGISVRYGGYFYKKSDKLWYITFCL